MASAGSFPCGITRSAPEGKDLLSAILKLFCKLMPAELITNLSYTFTSKAVLLLCDLSRGCDFFSVGELKTTPTPPGAIRLVFQGQIKRSAPLAMGSALPLARTPALR